MNVDLPTFGMPTTITRTDADQTFFVPLGDLVRQQRANCTGERLRAIAAAAVGLDDRHALLTEMLRPDSRHVPVSQVDAVEDHTRLACCNLIHIRVAGHLRNACVHDQTASTCLIYSAICRRAFVMSDTIEYSYYFTVPKSLIGKTTLCT